MTTKFFSFISSANIRNELKTSFHLVIPLIASQLMYGISSFASTVMVSHLGEQQLAANALVWGIYITVILFFIGIFSAVSIMTSQSLGAKDNDAISICFKQSLILAILAAVPMALIMWFSPIVLKWTGQNQTIIEIAKPMFHTLAFSMLSLNLAVVMQQFLYGILKPRIVMYCSLLVIPIEILLFYAFLFGKFGMPNLGLAGIGVSLTISMALDIVVQGCFLVFSHSTKHYNLFNRWWHINRKFLTELLRVGFPLGVTFCMEVALFAIVAIMMGLVSTITLAAYQISYQFLMLSYYVIFAFTQCTLIRVGNEVGKNNRESMQLAVLVNLCLSSIFMIIFSIFYLGFPHLVISLDLNVSDPNLRTLVDIASKFLAIVSVFIFTDNIRIIFNGASRGVKDSKFMMLASVLGFWLIAFPCSYLFGFKLGFGGNGIWWGLVLGLFVSGIMLGVRFWRLSNKITLAELVTRS